MFFSPALLAFFFSLFLVGQVAAAPLPMPAVAAIESPLKRQATVPVEEASKSDGGPVLPYKRRDVAVQDASKSDGGVVLPYKRQTVAVQDASKSDGTVIVAYERRDVPVQVASKSDGTNVVPYKRYSEIPLEVAVRSVDGVVELY